MLKLEYLQAWLYCIFVLTLWFKILLVFNIESGSRIIFQKMFIIWCWQIKFRWFDTIQLLTYEAILIIMKYLTLGVK